LIKTLVSVAVLLSAANILFAQQNDELQLVVVKAPFDHSTGKQAKTTSTQILYHGARVARLSLDPEYVGYTSRNTAAATASSGRNFNLKIPPQYAHKHSGRRQNKPESAQTR
jgi:hypothetical protein